MTFEKKLYVNAVVGAGVPFRYAFEDITTWRKYIEYKNVGHNDMPYAKWIEHKLEVLTVAQLKALYKDIVSQ